MAKLSANSERDRDTDERLRQSGWTVLRYWEHEDTMNAADEIESLVRPLEL
jgi:DNA mismatch endonuclease (patch repair protein)